MERKGARSKELVNAGSKPLEERLGKFTNGNPVAKPTITRVTESSVLSRVKGFLPVLASANESLLQSSDGILNSEKLNIESLDADDSHISMDIALVEMDGSDWSSSSDSEDDSDSDNEVMKKVIIGSKCVTEDNMKIRTPTKDQQHFKPDMIQEVKQ